MDVLLTHCTHETTSRCTAGIKEKRGKRRFFHWLQWWPIKQQVLSSLFQSRPIRGDDELRLIYFSLPWFAAVVWHGERDSLCSSHGSVCHTRRSRQPRPVWEEFIECFFIVLLLWHIPSFRTIINYLKPQQCVPKSECLCMCVWSQYVLFGSSESHASDVSHRESTFLLCFLGHWHIFVDIRRTETCSFICGLSFTPQLWTRLWGILRLTFGTGKKSGLLLFDYFSWRFYPLNTSQGHPFVSSLFLDLSWLFVKMPEANYLLSVSWGYIKVGIVSLMICLRLNIPSFFLHISVINNREELFLFRLKL